MLRMRWRLQRLRRRPLARLLVLKVLLRQFAHRGLWQFGANFHRAELLVLTELVVQEVFHLFKGEGRGTGFQLDERLRRLPAIFIAYADDRYFLDGRMFIDCLLDDARIDVKAAAE